MINTQKVLQDTYNNIAKLGFGDLVLLQVQLADHINNCWQHHQLKKEAATRPSEQSLPDSDPPAKKPGLHS